MCGSGYGNAPTKRGGSDGKGKGSDDRPKRHERPIAAAARGMGREGGGNTLCTVPKVRIGVAIRQPLIESVAVGVSRLCYERHFFNTPRVHPDSLFLEA